MQWVDGSLLTLYVDLEIYAYEMCSFVGTFTKRDVREKMNVDHYDLNGRVIGVVGNLRLCSGNARRKKKNVTKR